MQVSRKCRRIGSARSTMSGMTENGATGNMTQQTVLAPCLNYNDCSTADVVLHLVPQDEPLPAVVFHDTYEIRQDIPIGQGRSEGKEQESSLVPDCPIFCATQSSSNLNVSDIGQMTLFLHQAMLIQCRYFAARLSGRWQDRGDCAVESSKGGRDGKEIHLSMSVSPANAIQDYATTFELLYSRDFMVVIRDVQSALSILAVAAELLFDDCINACVKYLEAVPWTKQEEQQIVDVVSCLQLEQSSELLARLKPVKEDAVLDMLGGLVKAATHNHQNVACVKAFVAKVLSTYASRDTVGMVLDKAFTTSLKTVQDAIEDWSSPNVRGRHDEIEALQRQNLRIADTYARHLLWLVERMIELKVASNAVAQWSEPGSFTVNLERAFSENAGRNVAPGLPSSVLRCTYRLANAVAAGSIIASRQVRLNLVRGWLPVLIVSRENARTDSKLTTTRASELQELEEVFLRIILTLPMANAQELLQLCLSFATRTVEDCPHLVAAFNTWFRRAGEPAIPGV